MEDKERARPKYQVIADDLRTKIASGTYAAGTQLPTKAVLVELYSVAPGTLDRALDVLRDEGLTETFHGVGTFVRASGQEDEEDEDLPARVARLEAQMQDVYANLGMAPPTGQSAGNSRQAG
ncbi:GntR family transcriptional regulator [Nocardia sp. NPDC050799]|uniref:GntR family transcriptional regulator n=1 Tax=Nocardia sp. NPDC050799 TaxID=3154842 RepID=UPI0033F21FED